MIKLDKPLIVAGVLFFIAQLSLGVFSAFAEDTETGPAREWFDKARQAAQTGKYDEAISYADKAIQIKPDYVYAYNMRGLARSQKNLFEKAVEDFDAAIKIKPDFSAAYINRGSAKYYLGLYDSCIVDQDMALTLSPNHGSAYLYRARAYYGKKLYDLAIADYSRALAIEPLAFRYSSRADAYLGKGEHNLAIQDMKKAVLLEPANDEFKQKLEKLEGKTVAVKPSGETSADSMMYAVAPEESKESKQSDRKPRTQVEALMPPIGPDEISVVLMGPAIDESEKKMRDYFSSPQFDYFLEAKNVFDVTPKLAGITRSTGKKIKYLIIAGHGDPDPQTTGFGITRTTASGPNTEAFGQREIDREQWEFNYKLLTKKRNKLLREWAEDPSRKSEKETKQELEAIEKGLLNTFNAFSSVYDMTGVMAQDGVIIMFNCFSGMTEHLAFAKNLGRILFGENYGTMLLHNKEIWISRMTSLSEKDSYEEMAKKILFKFLGWYMEGHWKHGGEVFTWATYSKLSILPTAPALIPPFLYVSIKTPYRVVNEGATVEIESVVKGVYDSGAFDYQWAGEAVGKIGPKCKLDIYDTAGKSLKGNVIVTDEKGRKGEATFYIYIQKILADIRLSEKTPAAGSTVDASALVTQGKRPADTYWEWQADGGLVPQQKYGDTIKVNVKSAGKLTTRLVSDDVLLGKGRVLAEASVTINPKGQAKPAPRTDEPKQEKPEKPAGEGTSPTEVALPTPASGSESGAIDSSTEDLEGTWTVPTDAPSLKREIFFSRNGKSYTGKIVVEEGFGSNSFQTGEEAVRVTRVGPNIYKGEYLSIFEGVRTWRSHTFAVKDDVFYITDLVGQEDVDPTICRRKKSEAMPEAINVRVEKTSPATDTIVVGGKAQFRATANSSNGQVVKGLNFRWQPHPEIEFEPFEKSTVTTATFRKPGTYNIYVQALRKDGARYVTVGESNQVTVTVANPGWKLEFNPPEPLIGQEMKAKISPDVGKDVPGLDMKEMNFRWELSANARQTGTSKDDREITFYLTDAKSAKISCLASTKYENENLGGATRTITAKAYNVTIQGPRPRQEFQKWQSNTQLGGASSTGMRKAGNQYVVGQEILFSAKIEPSPEKSVYYDWTVSPEDCTLNSNGGSDTSIICSSAASYTIKVTARMDGMEIGSATASVSVSAEPTAVQPGSRDKSIQKLVWGSLPDGWTVSNGALLSDRTNVIAGTGERILVDNPEFSDNVYFRFAAEPISRYKIRATVEVGPAREKDFSTPEKIAASFADSKGRMSPGFQGTRECQFQGFRAIRYDVGSPKSTQKEWGYFFEVDPARKLWSSVMCRVEAVYSGPKDEGPSKEKQINKRLELEQTVERLLENQIRIKS